MPNESFCMKTTTAIVLAALALGLMQTACTSRDKDSEAPIKKPAAQVHTYTMRGIVVALPTTDAETAAKRRPLRIHHEPVHPFHNREGKDVGMGEMTMEFPYLKKGVSSRVSRSAPRSSSPCAWITPAMSTSLSNRSRSCRTTSR